MSRQPSALLFTLISLFLSLPISSAQNCSNTSPANSTSTQSFRFTTNATQGWFLTSTLTDTRNAAAPGQIFQSYLSAPGYARNASVCTYALSGLDVGAGTGEGGCDSVLTTQCKDWLVRDMNNRTPLGSSSECASLPDLSALRQNCGDDVADEALASRGAPILMSNTTSCAISSPPGGTISLSSDYVTLPALEFSLRDDGAGRDKGDFTAYDRYFRQVRPWIIAERENGQVQTRVVCVAPNQVVGASRQPKEGGAGRKRVGMEVVLGVVVAVALMW